MTTLKPRGQYLIASELHSLLLLVVAQVSQDRGGQVVNLVGALHSFVGAFYMFPKYFRPEEYPKNYANVPYEDDDYNHLIVKTDWQIEMFGHSTYSLIEACRDFDPGRNYEFIYQLIIINKYHSRRRILIREVVKLTGSYWFYSKTIDNVFYKPNYNQLNFQAFAYAVIEKNGLRKLNFNDENVYGKSNSVLINGWKLEVPIQTIKKGAPLLAKYIDKKKPKPKLKCSEEFFQVFHGVHVQLEVEEIKKLLKFAFKFEVLNVKRYCEQQLIRREDLEISEKRKFKMACKFNLNVLMNQLLRDVKTVKKLAKLASIAVEMKSMDTSISKLLIAKMYQVS